MQVLECSDSRIRNGH